MDELIIGEDKYVSSKRAAEITGYAKDYIGQLCREGRVEARLVGRNWYVLESSLHDHRFGPEPESLQEIVTEPQTQAADAVWQSPHYEAEEATPVTAIEGPVEEPEGEPDQARHLTEMRTAWNDWFEMRRSKNEEKGNGEERTATIRPPQEVPLTIIKRASEEELDTTRIVRETLKKAREAGKPMLVLQASLLAVAIIIVAVTYIGLGFMPIPQGSFWTASVIEGLSGAKTYTK